MTDFYFLLSESLLFLTSQNNHGVRLDITAIDTEDLLWKQKSRQPKED